MNKRLSVKIIGIDVWHGKLFTVCALVLAPGSQQAMEVMVMVRRTEIN